MKKIIIFCVAPFSLLMILILVMCVGGAAASGQAEESVSKIGLTVCDVSDDVLKYKTLVEKYCAKFDVSDYVPYLLAIMQVESAGKGSDVMQCSESMGLPPNSISSPEKSIEQGCKVFSGHLSRAKNFGCDVDCVIQAYNYGGSFLDYAAGNGKKYTLELAMEFAKGKSSGQKVSYVNNVSEQYGGWKYTYGNMFYVLLVKQYITYTTNGSSDISSFALQFVGEDHIRFTSYKSKNSQAFGADWCAMFVSYCADQCGYIDNGQAFWFNGCTTAFNIMLAEGKFKYSSFYHGNYVPKAGDFIFFTNSYGASSNHVGIVTGCENGTVKTVEGNSGSSSTSPYWMGSSVVEHSYDVKNSSILGYYSLN